MIPEHLCQRCTAPLGERVFRADRDRVCESCAAVARRRGEEVELVAGDGPRGILGLVDPDAPAGTLTQAGVDQVLRPRSRRTVE